MSFTTFELIVFNVGQGDCLLLKLPDDKYGLIDFHYDEFINGKDNSKRVIPPSLTYLKHLKESGKDISIAFLHFSHYHSDHIKGVLLLEDFLLKNGISMDEMELWLPLGFDILDIESVIYESDKYYSLKTELRIKCPNFNEYRASITAIREMWEKRKKTKRKKIFGIKNQYNTEHLNIYSLAPDSVQITDNGEDVIREFFDTHLLPKFNDGEKSTISKADRNLLSSILKVSNGQIRVILGGDACKVTWKKVLEEIPENIFDHKYGLPINYQSRLIKVSHHGASNASFTAKWESILESYPELHFIFSAGLHRQYKHPHDQTFKDIESVSLQKNAKAIHYSTNSYKDSKIAKTTLIDWWPIVAQDSEFKKRVQTKMIQNLEEDNILKKAVILDANLTDGVYYDSTHKIADPNLIGFRFTIGEDIVAERLEIA